MTDQEIESSLAAEVVLPVPRTTAEILLRTAKYMRKYAWSAAANLSFSVLSLVSSFVFPQVTQFIIDDVIGKGMASFLMPAILVLVLAYTMRDAFDSLHIRVSASLEQDVIYDMRRDVYERLQRLPIPFFDRQASGDLMTRVMEDITTWERIIIDGLEMGMTSLLSVVIVTVILFAKDPELAFCATAPLPILIGGTLWYSRIAHVRYRAQRRSSAIMNALISDNLQGIRQIKAFGQEGPVGQRLGIHADSLRRRSLSVMNLWSLYSPTMNLAASLGFVLVLWVGGPLVASGRLTLGELVGFMFYLPLLYEPISRLHRLNQMLQAARAAGERVCDVLDAAEEQVPQASKRKLAQPIRGEVRYEGVNFGYKEGYDALRNITLHALPGEVIALVGQTGCGKSTLVNLLLSFYRGYTGKIEIDGQDIDGVSIESLRSAIGVVTQETFLFNGTIRENIAFARNNAGDEELFAACRAANCHDFIMRLPGSYDSRVGERGIRLSVGEKQRISIARALLKDAPILILDEATASVDTGTEHLIQEALQRLMANRTTFIIAHRLATVRYANQIFVMQNGEVVDRGTHTELTGRNSLYRMLCNAQAVEFLLDTTE